MRYRRFVRDPADHGVVAVLTPIKHPTVESFLRATKEAAHPPSVIGLDNVANPYNIGGVIRSAECAGVDCILLAPDALANHTIRHTVDRIAMSAAAFLPVYECDLVAALETLRQYHVRTFGVETDGSMHYDSADLSGPVALFFGGERHGLSSALAERCDALLTIPLAGLLPSINIAHAVAVTIFEHRRQRRQRHNRSQR